MIKVVSNTQGKDNWIQVLGHSGSMLWEGHQVNVLDLQYILNIVSRDGAELIEANNTGIE
jgi:hypothetical protein